MDICARLPTPILVHSLSFLGPNLFAQNPDMWSITAREEYRLLMILAGGMTNLLQEYYRSARYHQRPIIWDCFHRKPFPPAAECLLNSRLFDFIKGDSSLVIAGGFATQLWLNRAPDASSDIDIYTLDVEDGVIMRMQNFLLANGATNLKLLGRGIYEVFYPELQRRVQVICLKETTRAVDVLESFDLSYCKVAIYKGELLATPDAAYSLKNKVTIGYKKEIRHCRLAKANARYGIKCLNATMEKSCKCQDRNLNRIVFDDDSDIEDPPQLGALEIRPMRGSDYATCHTPCFSHRIVKRVDLRVARTPPPLTYLEKCLGVVVEAYIPLVYHNPAPYFHHIDENLFYTLDPNFNHLALFWKEQENIFAKLSTLLRLRLPRSIVRGRKQLEGNFLLKRIRKREDQGYDQTFQYFRCRRGKLLTCPENPAPFTFEHGKTYVIVVFFTEVSVTSCSLLTLD